MSTTAHIPTSQISPPTSAARLGVMTPLWEAKIKGFWSHAEIVLNVFPVHLPRSATDPRVFDWGGYVYARNVTTGNLTEPLLVRSPNPHVVVVWGPAAEFSDGDLVQIVAEPFPLSDGKAAVWVNSAHITVYDSLPPATPTLSDPVFVVPPLGFDEALFDVDTFQ